MNLTPLPPADARRIRDLFASAGYSDDGFRRRPEFLQLPTRRSASLPVLLDATREPGLLHLLVRLFLLGVPVQSGAVEAHVPAPAVAAMIASGMLTLSEGEYSATVMLIPNEEALVANDSFRVFESPQVSDVILWPNQTTRLLQRFAARSSVNSVLDLGAGSGPLALLAARSAKRVVASDLNPRAAAFVHFNASLNGFSNIEARTGDTFGPLAGEKFDRILANPPFLVTPAAERMYGENPMDLDGYCRRVVREAPAFLAEGGTLQMIFEWVELKDESWQKRIAEWVEGSGCDAWFVRTYSVDPATYAHQRTRERYVWDPPESTARFDALLQYYRERGIRAIHGGLLAMRRRAQGPNWIRIEECRVDPLENFGEILPEVFGTFDALSSVQSEAAMLAWKPKLASGVRLEQRLTSDGSRWMPATLTMQRPGALPASMPVEAAVADFAVLCNGERDVSSLAREVAGRVNAPADAIARECCTIVRRLAERRFLTL